MDKIDKTKKKNISFRTAADKKTILTYAEWIEGTPYIDSAEDYLTTIGNALTGKYITLECLVDDEVKAVVFIEQIDRVVLIIQMKILLGYAKMLMEAFYDYLRSFDIEIVKTTSQRKSKLIERFFGVKKVYTLYQKDLTKGA